MFVSNISLSYAFLGIGIIALIFFVYFKVLTIRTEPNNIHREAIIGDMKYPDVWRNKNNKMAYVSLFWAIVSTGIFIYLKFFWSEGVMSVAIPFIYIGVIAVSASVFSSRGKTKAH